MIVFLTMLHVLICVALIMVVLMQSAKGEGLAGAFGGSGITGAVFGGRGAATFLSKATTILAIAFFVSCILLSFLSPSTGGGGGSSGIQKEAERRAGEGTPATNVPSTTPQQQPSTQQPATTPPAGEGK